MKILALGIAVVISLFLIAVIPAGASVMKDKHTSSWNMIGEVPIAPDRTALCDLQYTRNDTEWISTKIPIWKTDYSLTIESMCDDGTHVECAEHSVANLQNFEVGSLKKLGTFIVSLNCWFYYPDGTKAKIMLISVYANGEPQVTINGRWN
jgi:hypothetical protein